VQIILETHYISLLPANGVSTSQSELPVRDVVWTVSDLELYKGALDLLLRTALQINMNIHCLDLVASHLIDIIHLDLYWLSYLDECSSGGSYVL
jgi:hypothetical protein